MLHKELLSLSGNKDLGPVKIRILYCPYNGNKEAFVGYGASNDDYISKIPYWNNKDHDFLDELGAEKMLEDDGDYVTTYYENRFSAGSYYDLNYAIIKFSNNSTVTIPFLDDRNAKSVFNILTSHAGEEAEVTFSPEPTGYL